jgi:hypothetical protein
MIKLPLKFAFFLSVVDACSPDRAVAALGSPTAECRCPARHLDSCRTHRGNGTVDNGAGVRGRRIAARREGAADVERTTAAAGRQGARVEGR